MISTDQQVQEFSEENRDYAAIEMRGPLCTISLMQMREGQVIGRALYRAEAFGDETETLLAFLIQYYADGLKLPQYLYVSHEIEVDLIRRYFPWSASEAPWKSSLDRGENTHRILRMARKTRRRMLKNG